jgi:hypothetical protein
MIGQPLTMLRPEFMRQLHSAGFRSYLGTQLCHMDWQGAQVTGLRKNGEEFPIELSFGNVPRSGRHIFTGFIRDATERKQAEEILAAHARHAGLRRDVSLAFASVDTLKVVLHGCADAIAKKPRWHVNVTMRPALSRCRRSAFPSPGPSKEEAAGERMAFQVSRLVQASRFPPKHQKDIFSLRRMEHDQWQTGSFRGVERSAR